VNEEIEFGQHARWLPIPLGVDPEEIRRELAAAFAPTTPDADTYAAAVAGVATRLAADADPATPTLAAWALVRTPNEIDVCGFATLRVTHVGPDTTDDDALAAVTGAMEVIAEPLTQRIQTLSGEALSLRVRPLVRPDDGPTQVHQLNAVLWVRPQHQALFVLSQYETDLAQAVPAADLLDELAAGFAGMQP